MQFAPAASGAAVRIDCRDLQIITQAQDVFGTEMNADFAALAEALNNPNPMTLRGYRLDWFGW